MPCIDRLHDVSNQNRQMILDFENYNRINQRSRATIRNYTKLLSYFGRHLGNKSFQEVTKKDVEEFFSGIKYNPNSQDMMKIGLRFFYRWMNDLEKGDRLPECVRWLKTRGKKQIKRETNPRQLKERIVTEDEYSRLIEISRGDLQAQAMIETLFWYGCRISELLSMNMDCVAHSDIGITITILTSKTEPRDATVLAKEHYPQKLMDWLDNHPNRGRSDRPIWISTDTRTYHRRLSVGQAEQLISTIGERANLGKHVKPHDFRHTSITRDCANGMAWTFVATKYGLEKNSCMQTVYDHNDHDKFLEHYRKQSNIVIKPTYNELEKQKQRLEQDYNKRLQEMEQRFKEMEIMLGFAQTQKRLHDKQTQELQEQDHQLQEQYSRGEL